MTRATSRQRRRINWRPVFLAGAAILGASLGHAEPAPAPADKGAAAKATAGIKHRPTMPSLDAIVTIVRATLVAVNQAMETENYTVLHAIAGPALQKNTTVEQLGKALDNFRLRYIDLSQVVISPPQFTQTPFIDQNGLLRLTGFFPTAPQQVRFNLTFSMTDGGWRLEGLSLDAAPAPPGQTATRSDFLPQPTQAVRRPAEPPVARPPSAPASPDLDRRTNPPTTTKY